MPRRRLVPATLRAAVKPRRIAAAGGVALVGLPVIGAVADRLRAGKAAAVETAGPETIGLGASLFADPTLAAEAERANQAAQNQVSQVSQTGTSGTDFGASSGSWSLDGAPDLLGLGGKVVSAGIDGAGEVAGLVKAAGSGLIEVAGAVGGALPDLGDIAGAAGAVGEAATDVLGAIGNGLGDLNF